MEKVSSAAGHRRLKFVMASSRIIPSISAEPRYEKKFVGVLGKQMAYVECNPPAGDTHDTIVFVHGNPTSSYMWRNVMPHCEDLVGPDGNKVRLIAPDLIGMGASDKLDNIEDPDRYSLAEQSKYFSAFLESVSVRERVTLVAHSWGNTLGGALGQPTKPEREYKCSSWSCEPRGTLQSLRFMGASAEEKNPRWHETSVRGSQRSCVLDAVDLLTLVNFSS